MGLFSRLASLVSGDQAAANTNTAQVRRPRRRRTARLTTSKTRWFLADLEGAIRFADGGDMSRAAQLYKALRRDGVIHGLLSTRTGGLVRMRRKFDGDKDVAAALEGKLSSQRTLFDEIFPPSELALLAADGLVLGVGVAEMVEVCDAFGNPKPYREMRRLDPEYLRYRWDEDAWYYNSAEGPVLITPGDGRWILHCPGGRQEPWQHGLWSSLGRAYIAKEHAFLHRENYSAKLANPARVAIAPQGSTEAQRQSWFQKVMAWGVNTVFGMTPGYDVKLLESNGRGYEVFEATITTSNQEFMVALVGQIVTVTGGAGFANADVHATVRSDLIEETGDGLAHTLNTQGIPPWANHAFGGGRRADVKYDTTKPKSLKEEADSLTAVAGAISALDDALARHGRTPDADAILTKFGVPVRGDKDGDARPDTTEAPLEDEEIAALAQKMTEFQVPRCEHNRANRCWLCGIERVRDFRMTPNGTAWSIAWRPVRRAAPAKAAA